MDHKIRGFTLLELIIVMTLISIVTLLAGVSVRWQSNNSRLIEMRDVFLAHCEFARIQSIAREPHALFLSRDKYEIRRLHDTNRNFIRDAGEPTYVFPDSDGIIELPENMTLSWTSCNKNNELWFDRKGVPRCNKWGLGMGTFTFQRDGQERILSIDSAGRITYE